MVLLSESFKNFCVLFVTELCFAFNLLFLGDSILILH